MDKDRQTQAADQSRSLLFADSAALAHDAAQLVYDAFAQYGQDYRSITQSSQRRFETRDWLGAQADAVERIELYDHSVANCIEQLRELLDTRLRDAGVWRGARQRYEELLGGGIDRELNKTYFNSLSRRLFGTVGVNRAIEFVDFELGPTDHVTTQVSIKHYPFTGELGRTCRRLLNDFAVNAPWRDLGDCAAFLHRELRRQLAEHGGTGSIQHFELVEPVFFRFTRAFIVGKIQLDSAQLPLIVALVHHPDGVAVDWVTTSVDEASVIFSYSRSYFHADLETIADTVLFLASILPHKPIEELYTALGRAKQGKTERYRGIRRHLRNSNDQMIPAPGTKGMVMAVFTLPNYPVVFKVIRDRFAPPKKVTRQDVLDAYDLVFTHNRAGRLVDAQEFKQLKFRLARFSEPVLEELITECGQSVSMEGDYLIIHHLYIERKLKPLNLYLSEAPEQEVERVIVDYGQAIKDLAMTDIFPGDLLLKNFGVSSHGRVIFYDYDELCGMADCKFRKMPPPRDDFEAYSDDVWFNVGPQDVFPEQFVSFLGLGGEHLELFKRHHTDLLTPQYWKEIQERLARGETFDVSPYAHGRTGQAWAQSLEIMDSAASKE
ncbi:MAG: bifunctional isocitrate dehydrogenase kinase/phosphatase [Xanthomonadales bacterium]|nr:bifunctional isocitrate dehydrogenase kinase/phosphatase [Xanthomonadales bacterium]